MNRFLSFTRKEFYHIIRDPRTMLILIAMPIVQIILFGFAISVEITGINVAIVAPVKSEIINQITEKVDANKYFTVKGCYVDSKEVDDLLRSGEVDICIHFPSDFEKSIINKDASLQIKVEASNPNIATSEQIYLQKILTSCFAEKYSNSSISLPPIDIKTILLFNPRMESAYNFVPGLLGLIMIIICAMMTSVSIVREKETGTMEVLLVSPLRPIVIIIAKMIPYLIISCFNLFIILVISKYVLDVPLEGSIFWISAISILYILLSLALGLLISTLVRTQMAAMLCSVMLLMLPVLMLSDMLFTIESAPKFFRIISTIVPAKWYIAAMRKLMIEGLPISYILKETTILLMMTTILIFTALKNFKNRL